MKIITIAGTRPELIRLSIIIRKLDNLVNHVFVYTNQNYTSTLRDSFFSDLSIREPDYTLEPTQGSFSLFISEGIKSFESILLSEKPDKILVLGDTNSGLLTLVANRMSIPIYHMEAGNRCFDKRVPEETNRRLIDHLSTYNLPYTDNSKQNLLAEGFDKNYVLKTGNPIYEVITYYKSLIDCSAVLSTLGLTTQEYVLVTMHRSENVDDVSTLSSLMLSLDNIAKSLPVIISVHPRTKHKMLKNNLTFTNENVKVCEPFGFFDFVYLEANAKAVISDSGTVQEECCLLGVPSLTIRESTERHETIECGSNILVGTNFLKIEEAFNTITKWDIKWQPPADYVVANVSDIVINILLGK